MSADPNSSGRPPELKLVQEPPPSRDFCLYADAVSKSLSPSVSSGGLTADEVCRFAEKHGWRDPLKEVTYAVWARRYELENGWCESAVVDAAELPDDVPAFVRRYWHGFLLLVRCRWFDESYYGRPVLFTLKWASAWCGLSVWQCKDARAYLTRLGVLVDSGERFGRATLWLPRRGGW
jgi:hypothetical protein